MFHAATQWIKLWGSLVLTKWPLPRMGYDCLFTTENPMLWLNFSAGSDDDQSIIIYFILLLRLSDCAIPPHIST